MSESCVAPCEPQPGICSAYLVSRCSGDQQEKCSFMHVNAPYLWQIYSDTQQQWISLGECCGTIEKGYSDPSVGYVICKITDVPSFHPDNVVRIEFENTFICKIGNSKTGNFITAPARRLSTPSFVRSLEHDNMEMELSRYLTLWCWYYQESDGTWRQFSRERWFPPSPVIEAKFLSGQEVFRFSLDVGFYKNAITTVLLDFRTMELHHSESGQSNKVQRRPEYISLEELQKGESLSVPDPRDLPHWSRSTLPAAWYPYDTQEDYELIPLNPHSTVFGDIAAQLFIHIPADNVEIKDIFRLQNPFLWQKYQLKKSYMERHNTRVEEKWVYHGTNNNEAVVSIFTQNFDSRMSGKNGTVYGDGIYFASTPKFSHLYTQKEGLCWMFVVRMMPGRWTLGRRDMRRPPPVDPSKPYQALFNSCVNNVTNPSIYVLFENDQCYPEYVVCYEAKGTKVPNNVKKSNTK